MELISKIFIYTALAAGVLAAVGAVSFPNLFHAALCLVAALIGVAILYLALQAEFIAVIQILLYVGAVMTLIIFAIMLTQRLNDKSVAAANSQRVPAFLILAASGFFLIKLILKVDWPEPSAAYVPVSAGDLGQALLGPYVLPFEAVSILLIGALIGAIVIARKD